MGSYQRYGRLLRVSYEPLRRSQVWQTYVGCFRLYGFYPHFIPKLTFSRICPPPSTITCSLAWFLLDVLKKRTNNNFLLFFASYFNWCLRQLATVGCISN